MTTPTPERVTATRSESRRMTNLVGVRLTDDDLSWVDAQIVLNPKKSRADVLRLALFAMRMSEAMFAPHA